MWNKSAKAAAGGPDQSRNSKDLAAGSESVVREFLKRGGEPEMPRYPDSSPSRPLRAPTAAPPPAHGGMSPPVPDGAAAIGKEMSVRGDIRASEDLWVNGNVEGTLELPEHRLTVGPNGQVKADIRAREVVVLGNVQGNVEAREKVTIRKDARLVGDLRMAGIQIDDGAYFKGTIDIVHPEPRPVAASPTRQAPCAEAPPAANQTSSRP